MFQVPVTVLLNTRLPLGIVYWTILGHGAQFGSIKRAYMTTFDDHGSNQMKDVDLNLRYISSPDGIAVDWVGRYVKLLLVFLIIFHVLFNILSEIPFEMIALLTWIMSPLFYFLDTFIGQMLAPIVLKWQSWMGGTGSG